MNDETLEIFLTRKLAAKKWDVPRAITLGGLFPDSRTDEDFALILPEVPEDRLRFWRNLYDLLMEFTGVQGPNNVVNTSTIFKLECSLESHGFSNIIFSLDRQTLHVVALC